MNERQKYLSNSYKIEFYKKNCKNDNILNFISNKANICNNEMK